MSINSFDSESGTFCVLMNRNGEGRHSPWSIFADAPAVWTIMCGAKTVQFFWMTSEARGEHVTKVLTG